jgi:CRISPR-associated protein (TIGR02584 family)
MTYSRRILLVITGLTPQVVTETLFALWQEAPETLPTEIHVISTAEGVERARLTLFSDAPGWFHRLCKDYRLPPIRFDADSLHTLTDVNGSALNDIRSGQDNTAAADGITEWVRRLTEDDDTRLHVSLAGGRKTLGFFAGYALSLYGRSQDRLSHVLVDAPFESHPGFFYPTPYSHVIYASPPDQKPLDTQNAAVTLADIPFVRLRHGLPEALLKGRSSFSAAVRAAQTTLGPARLDIDLSARTVTAGGIAIPFPPAELAFYAWLARRAQRELPPLPCPPDGAPDRDYAEGFLAEYRAIIGELGDDDRVVEGLKYGMEKNYFERRKSRVNRMLRDTLGSGTAGYEIATFGRRPCSRFGLGLASNSIYFGPFTNGGDQ